MNRSVDNISNAPSLTAADAAEVAGAGALLSKVAEDLHSLVRQFKTH